MPLTKFTKSSIIDVWQDPKYAPEDALWFLNSKTEWTNELKLVQVNLIGWKKREWTNELKLVQVNLIGWKNRNEQMNNLIGWKKRNEQMNWNLYKWILLAEKNGMNQWTETRTSESHWLKKSSWDVMFQFFDINNKCIWLVEYITVTWLAFWRHLFSSRCQVFLLM